MKKRTYRKTWHCVGNHFKRESILPVYLKRTGYRKAGFRLNFDFSRDFSYQPLINDKVLILKSNLGYYEEVKSKIKRLKKYVGSNNS